MAWSRLLLLPTFERTARSPSYADLQTSEIPFLLVFSAIAILVKSFCFVEGDGR